MSEAFGAMLDAAEANQSEGRLTEAESLCRQVLEAAPKHARALYLLGTLALQAGRNDVAISLMRQSWEQEPEQLGVLFHWAQLAFQRGRLEEVLATLSAATERFPNHPELHERIGSLLHARGQGKEAEASFRRALHLAPNFAAAHAGLGVLLYHEGRMEESLAASRRAAELKPGSSAGHYGQGLALRQCGQAAEATEAFERALQYDPHNRQARWCLAEARLRSGDAAGALGATNPADARGEYHSGILAIRYYALRELGQTEAADELLALDRLTHQAILRTPPGFHSIQEMNEVLAAELQSHPSLMWEPIGKTTRRGHQSANLLEAPTPAFTACARAIGQEVADFVARLPRDAHHPFLRHKPASYGFHMWATILQSGGHQAPHIHPSGWLSGVYYVRTPMPHGDAAPAGWIEFGRPPSDLPLKSEPPIFALPPQEGLLVLFPSYLYHRTIPFDGTAPRISLAFDVIP
jgi:uncharacterized protein (TIGR02466 family)